jgi:carboxy-cis,cis-muconate cyclase
LRVVDNSTSNEGGTKDVSNAVHVERWETPTSGGKANAIELKAQIGDEGEGVWIVLTDDEPSGGDGVGVRVLAWDAQTGVRVVAAWPEGVEDGDEAMRGASHAVWLD